nr:reverse transcriptase domain-containing protein [Tanacetum cinerariifolium]
MEILLYPSSNKLLVDKRRGGNEGEGSRPQIKRRKTYVVHKDGSATLERISSSKPFQTVWPTGLTRSGRNLCCLVRASTNTDKTKLFLSSLAGHSAYRSLNAEKAPSPLPITLHGARVKDGESSYSRALYVSEWIIHQRCRVESPMWCQELMVHLAPPAAQEESNALTNMALQVKELEAKLAKKDSALVYVERISAERVAKKEKLAKQLSQERKELAAIHEARYKTKLKQYYNKRVHLTSFKPREFIFQKNKECRVEDQGKLGPK